MLTGCVLKPKYIIQNYKPPQKISILPFENYTTDFDAPIVVRNIFAQMIKNKNYTIKSLDETDNILKENGITQAGQLNSISYSELGKILDVDAVIYGKVLEFNYITLGIYYKRAVRANFKLINTHSGELLWEDEKVSYTQKIVTEKIAEEFKKQLIEKTVDKILKSPLIEETQDVVRWALSTLPDR